MPRPIRSSRTELIGLLVAWSLTASCGHGLLQRSISEGIIEYALSFPTYDPSGLMAGMLPERTTLTFNEDKAITELSAGMGVFRTAIVTDQKTLEMDYHLSVLSKKLVSRLRAREVDQMNRREDQMAVLFTNTTDTIAGFPCRKAYAIFSGIDKPEVELWYTEAIEVENGNWYTPFPEIPGVLMRYEIEQFGMRMHLNATSVTASEVDPKKFEIRKDHRSVPPQVLRHELEELLESFGPA
jgi:GLPGLI family protein